jgi:acyl-CoA dehydrogenase
VNSEPNPEVVHTAISFAARHVAPVAADADQVEPRFPEEVFARGIAAGFDRMVLPETAGGDGFGMVDLCALVKSVAETCAGHAMVFAVHAAALKSLLDAGGPESQSILESISASRKPIAVYVPEPLSWNDFETPFTAHQRPGVFYQLSGQGALAFNASPSGWFLLFARTSDGMPLAFLSHDKNGTLIREKPEQTLGLRAMPVCEVTLETHQVLRENVIAEGERAVAFYRSLISNLCVVTAAVASGVIESAFRKALTYARERYQGGKMIIDHSHLRSILGRMSAGAIASRGALFHAAAQELDDLTALGTKVSVTEHAVRSSVDAVQMLGGYGYIRDFGLEKTMRDAAMLSLLPVSNDRAELLITAIEKEKSGGKT